MTSALHLAKRTWTESEYLAIGETPERIELFDGSLHVSPIPTGGHQHIASELQAAMRDAVRHAGLYSFQGLNIRLRPGHIRVPDFLITTTIDYQESVYDVGVVRLACEIVSPSNPATDKLHKMHYYAEAGIPWYLVIDPRAETFHLYQLNGNRYAEHASASPGKPLELIEPVAVTIDPADLLPPS
ncbi:Uma2 family endonuclease [Actinoplanes utahensis]|uniref:Putative restriction endonuclease domain-containing protein n=1 Tax=Actinoplanes utahensis TaxID=1869 RepID=A0A0A6UEM9_ACTUT|nr:Uma2 family endonuclease [Actinoplanes utahensis]KHD72749.1 hypothetical protein MB27_40835 [Actinoplanes utahensis]